MMASSRPVCSPMSTVIFEVPISTAPMKVVLELTFVIQLGTGEERKQGRGGGRRTGGLRVRRYGFDGDRHFAPERQVDAGARASKTGEPLDDVIEVRELYKKT